MFVFQLALLLLLLLLFPLLVEEALLLDVNEAAASLMADAKSTEDDKSVSMSAGRWRRDRRRVLGVVVWPGAAQGSLAAASSSSLK